MALKIIPKKTVADEHEAARREAGRIACLEIQQLAVALRTLHNTDALNSDPGSVPRGILTRIATLSDVIYEAFINDQSDRQSVGELQRLLGLEPPYAEVIEGRERCHA